MNKIDLGGRVAIVTGGAQGIGFAVAERFAQSGAKLAIWDRDKSELGEARKKLGGEVLEIAVDIRDADATSAAAAETH
ncbi:MAG TPA: SDR family NAD(P)-dependent oxidoreductase, partial [Verrucomicrobiae bacterium]|nr:SDR family NAD(P)-dependent oxidoreductase [Verrucomicrobiae bacterium]